MDRRAFMVTLTGSLLAAPLASEAQQPGRVYRLGYLSTPTRQSVERGVEAFLRRLRQLGWVEGQNLVVEYRWAEGNVKRLPELAAELVVRPGAGHGCKGENNDLSLFADWYDKNLKKVK